MSGESSFCTSVLSPPTYVCICLCVSICLHAKPREGKGQGEVRLLCEVRRGEAGQDKVTGGQTHPGKRSRSL